MIDLGTKSTHINFHETKIYVKNLKVIFNRTLIFRERPPSGPQVNIRDLAKCTLIIYTYIKEQLYYNHEVVTSVHFVKIKTIFTKSFEIIPGQEILLRSLFLC